MIINPKYKNVFFNPEISTEEPEIPIEEEATTTNPKPKKKNLITVLKKLLKAFGGDDAKVKNNAVDIIDKIADNVSSGSSGSGNVLTLYSDPQAQGESFKLYKNIELTEGYSSVEEGNEALLAAASIRVVMVHEGDILGIIFSQNAHPANITTGYFLPMVRLNAEEERPLYIENSGYSDSEEPEIEIHH